MKNEKDEFVFSAWQDNAVKTERTGGDPIWAITFTHLTLAFSIDYFLN